jgi:hypothetical protein
MGIPCIWIIYPSLTSETGFTAKVKVAYRCLRRGKLRPGLFPTAAVEAGFFLGLLAARLKPCPDTNLSFELRSTGQPGRLSHLSIPQSSLLFQSREWGLIVLSGILHLESLSSLGVSAGSYGRGIRLVSETGLGAWAPG